MKSPPKVLFFSVISKIEYDEVYKKIAIVNNKKIILIKKVFITPPCLI